MNNDVIRWALSARILLRSRPEPPAHRCSTSVAATEACWRYLKEKRARAPLTVSKSMIAISCPAIVNGVSVIQNNLDQGCPILKTTHSIFGDSVADACKPHGITEALMQEICGRA